MSARNNTTSLDEYKILIPMRGNECPVHDRRFLVFRILIPMRGNEARGAFVILRVFVDTNPHEG